MTFPVFSGSNPSGYNLTRSLRFRASAGGHLSKTFSTASDQKTFTISNWLKRGQLAIDATFFASVTDANNFLIIYYQASTDKIIILGYSGGSAVINISTSAVFRDPSAWYHVVIAFDTTQATGSNRVKLYINNTQQAVTFTTTPSLNLNALPSTTRYIGRAETAANYFDGYLTEVNFIDGQALTPSSFGSTNTLTGVWQPARYGGTYGTNGFYLPFTDNSALTTSSNVGLGKDFSGNGNYWTTNNISITAGVTYDSMTDVPTLTSATAANFAVLNSLDKTSSVTLTNGNLYYSVTSGSQCRASFGSPTSGLIYFEHKITSTVAPSTPFIVGGCTNTKAITDLNNEALALMFYTDSSLWQLFKRVNGTVTTINVTGTSYPVINDVVQIAYDSTNGKVWMGKNNSWIDSSGGITGNPSTATNPTFTFTAGQSFFPALFNVGAAYSGVLICGQQPFSYTPPTGFVALNTYNLPTSTIVAGNKYMDATLWTGNNTSRSIANAAPFKPDLVWIKSRSNAEWNILFDSVRGTGKSIYSNSTNVEVTNAGSGYVSAFNSDGFSVVGGSTDSANVNATGYTYVGWQWQAGQGSTSSNTNGSITSTVSVNASAGFSVVTFSATGSNATVGHGLGVAPSLVILKDRATVNRWLVYHPSLGATQGIYLEATNAATTSSTFWNNTAPTSSTVSIGTWSYSGNQVMYCWTPIAGYSAFGSFSGNGSTDGTFIYTGFRARWVMVKRTSSADDWRILDTARNTYNVMNLELYPNAASAETTVTDFDVVSNGIKLRNLFSGDYIYAAFAENPFKNALAR